MIRDIDGHKADYYHEEQRAKWAEARDGHTEEHVDRCPSGGGEGARWGDDTENGPDLRATLIRNSYGGFLARLEGHGYPKEIVLPSLQHSPLNAKHRIDWFEIQGYSIIDPDHLMELFGLSDEPVSQYADSRDAAEGPAVAFVGSVPGDDGGVSILVDEIEF